MKARQEWYTDTLLPKITLMFWKGVAATILASCGALFFIVRALITDHSLDVESIFVKQTAHREDVSRIERKVDELEVHVTASMQEVLDNQQKIMFSIREHKVVK
jgi:hypothetical protein